MKRANYLTRCGAISLVWPTAAQGPNRRTRWCVTPRTSSARRSCAGGRLPRRSLGVFRAAARGGWLGRRRIACVRGLAGAWAVLGPPMRSGASAPAAESLMTPRVWRRVANCIPSRWAILATTRRTSTAASIRSTLHRPTLHRPWPRHRHSQGPGLQVANLMGVA